MIDKSTIQQILGCLIQHPQFLSEVDKYNLSINDFSSHFEKIIFNSIKTLYDGGAASISAVDIDNNLDTNATYKKIFENNNGIEYVQDIIELSNIENFSYYYNRLKKLNLIRDLKKQGVDTSNIYVEDLIDPKAEEINKKFEELSTKDICDIVKNRLLKLESQYAVSEEVKVQSAVSGIESLIKKLREKGIGTPIQGNIYSQVIGGAQPGALTIRSGGSGLGKTRHAVGDACLLAYPIRYNSSICEWECIGGCDQILFIITEQTMEQVQAMILAYLTDIDESRFKYDVFSAEEEKVIAQAIQIMNEFENNFIIIKVPNPTIELIKTLVRENCLTRNIKHVFYDYVFIGPALLNEFRGFSLRNDKALSYI